MYPDPDDIPPDRKAIRRAPLSGDVVPSRPRPEPRHEPDDDPSEEDIARLDSPVRKCPDCRRDVFDDAEICHHCGSAFSRAPSGPSKLQIAIVGLIILAFLFFAIAGVF
jgi:hypothetical protein